MKRIQVGVCISILPILSMFPGCQPPEQQYSQRAKWDFMEQSQFRGKAEVATYEGTIIRYGKPREAVLVLITVLEPFLRDQLVKSESDTDFYAIKQNQVMSYQTGVYPYRQMNSVFWSLDSGTLLKAFMTTQEWCGQTYRELRKMGNTLQLFYSSYWEDESRGYETRDYPSADYTLLYDELPLFVRMDSLKSSQSVALYPMLMSSQIRRPDWDIGMPSRNPDFRKARLDVTTDEIQWQGNPRSVRIVTVTQPAFSTESGTVPEKTDVFYVDLKSSIRPLLRWERNDGGTLELSNITYTDYWEQNGPVDKLPQNLELPE